MIIKRAAENEEASKHNIIQLVHYKSSLYHRKPKTLKLINSCIVTNLNSEPETMHLSLQSRNRILASAKSAAKPDSFLHIKHLLQIGCKQKSPEYSNDNRAGVEMFG